MTVNLEMSFYNPMGWSLSSVSFRMSGSGSWQNLLPDETSRRLYADIYPMGRPLSYGSGNLLKLFPSWEQAGIVRFEKEKVIPLGPIMTNDDLAILNPWFQNISSFMSQTVIEQSKDYRKLASNLAKGDSLPKQEAANLLTILICALTLDSWVFSWLRMEVIGTYPDRGFSGNFFFWGYAFATGPQRIFGFTTYNGLGGNQLHMIRAHGLNREVIKDLLNYRTTWDYLDQMLWGRWKKGDNGTEEFPMKGPAEKIGNRLQEVGLLTTETFPRLAIPFFDDIDREEITRLCRRTAQKIADHWVAEMTSLDFLIKQCSFARCLHPDVLCMLFHLAYSFAADQLVALGVIPDFPERAGGEWGVWIS